VGREDTDEDYRTSEANKTRQYSKFEFLQRVAFDKKLATLFVLRGPDAGLRIPLTKLSVTVGRTLESDLVLDDEQVSRRHAMISHDPATNSYILTDLGSTNGTYVNDRPVTTSELKDGDKIFLGGNILKFVLQDEVDSESGELVDRLLFQDDLTGLVVKRRFYRDLELRILSSSAQNGELSVLMMDMDGLKQINDTHGHMMGAFVISEVGKVLGEMCNRNGQACRYGGDEFIAYLLNAPKAVAIEMGQKICDTVRNQVFVKDSIQVRASISVGVSTFPEDGKTIDVLVRAADEALYRAKGKGRDRVSA